MISAILKGIELSIANTNEAYEISKNFVEGLDMTETDVLRKVLEESVPFWIADTPGASNPEAWINMHAILLEMDLLQNPLDVQAAFTNEYTPEND